MCSSVCLSFPRFSQLYHPPSIILLSKFQRLCHQDGTHACSHLLKHMTENLERPKRGTKFPFQEVQRTGKRGTRLPGAQTGGFEKRETAMGEKDRRVHKNFLESGERWSRREKGARKEHPRAHHTLSVYHGGREKPLERAGGLTDLLELWDQVTSALPQNTPTPRDNHVSLRCKVT